MAYDVIPILLLIGCVVSLAVIIGRKFPQVRALDVESIPAERELRLKQRLLASRLRRHLKVVGRSLHTLSQPVVRGLLHWLKRSYQRVLELESRYRRPPENHLPPSPSDTLERLLADARQLQSNGQSAAAEEKLIELIGLDPRQMAAYELLGGMYLESHEFTKAREVYTYVGKLLRKAKAGPSGNRADRLAACYLNLATAYQGLGSQVQALQFARKAVALSPSNPRVLDFLLKISIVVKDKALAEKTWQSLQAADPQNAKLAELRGQIDQLP